MKTQIIQLESHDETISVKDKMEWSQTHRVLLLWPRRGKILRDQLDIVFLERYCATLGSQLAIVSKDPEVHFHAHQAGIPIFRTKREAQNKPWRRSWRFYQRKRLQKEASTPREIDLSHSPKKKSKSPEIPLLVRIGIFTGGVLAVLAIAAFLLPSAVVQVPPQYQWAENTLQVKASPQIEYVNVSGLVPAQEVTTSVEKRALLPSSGEMQIPNTFANGRVVFSNLSPHAIVIPQNTILSTYEESPTRFVTLTEVVVPAGLGEEIEVDIQALKPGEEGNQDSAVISAIASPLGADLKVTNPEPTRGGADMIIPAPTAADREKLTQAVLEELEASALDLIKEKISPEDVLLSTAPLIKEIELQDYFPAEDQPGDELELTMRIQFSAWVVRGDDLYELGQKTMTSSQTSAGFQPVPETLQIINLTRPILQEEEAYWDMLVMWQIKAVWNTAEIGRLLLGQNPLQAREFLMEKYELDHEPTISLSPAWWPRLPFLPFRMTVEG